MSNSEPHLPQMCKNVFSFDVTVSIVTVPRPPQVGTAQVGIAQVGTAQVGIAQGGIAP